MSKYARFDSTWFITIWIRCTPELLAIAMDCEDGPELASRVSDFLDQQLLKTDYPLLIGGLMQESVNRIAWFEVLDRIKEWSMQ